MSRSIRRGLLLFGVGLAAGAGGMTLLRPALVPTPAVGPAELTPVEAALDKPIPEIDLVGVPLPDAAKRVGELAGVPVTVDADAMAAAGLRATRPVTIRARNLSLAAALDELVDAGPAAASRPEWVVRRDRVTIGPDPASAAASNYVVRTYDVSRTVAAMGPVDESPTFSLYVQGGPGWRPPEPHDDLVRLIVDTVAPDSWRNNGGPHGSIAVVLDRLVVGQTARNHRLLRNLLRELAAPSTPVPPPDPPPPDVVRWHTGLQKWVVRNDRLAERKLLAAVPAFRADGARRAALRLWAAAAGVDLLIDPSAEAPLFVPADDPADGNARARHRMAEPVAVGLRSATAADALRAILDGADTRLTWWYDGEAVVVGDRESAAKQLVTRVYDVRDWFDAELADVPAATVPTERELVDRQQVRFEVGERLVRHVVESVDPDSWREAGGTVGVVKELSRQLIVTQSAEAQLDVRKLIGEVRPGARRPTSRPTTRPA